MIVKVYISLFMILLYNYFFGNLKLFVMFYLFILMHELSHMIMAIILDVDIQEISLMPIGVNAKYKGKISNRKELFVSLAGPIASMIFALLYNNKLYFIINTCIFSFNILPIYPLDGGRILRIILKFIFGDRIGIKVSQYISYILIFVLLVISIFLVLYYKYFFLLFLTLYIFRITREEMKKEKIIQSIKYLQIEK